MEKFEKTVFGDSVIYNADAFDVLPTLADEAIDICLTDMPYATESFGGKCTACEWDTPINLPEFWRLLECKAKPQANVVLFCNMKLAYDLIGSNLKGFRSDLVFAKPSQRVGHLNSNNQVMRAHENILLFRRPKFSGTAFYNPVKTAGGQPRVNRGKARQSGGVYPPGRDYTSVSNGEVHPISVLAFDRDRNLPDWCAHPTMKPLNLLGYLLMLYSEPGQVVLDCFSGSGSTACAAYRLGRRFIAVEKEKKYYDIACRRLEEIHQRKTARRQLTLLSFSSNPADANPTASESEPAVPPETESQQQNCEATNLQEDSI